MQQQQQADSAVSSGGPSAVHDKPSLSSGAIPPPAVDSSKPAPSVPVEPVPAHLLRFASTGWPLDAFAQSTTAQRAQLGIVSRANVANALFTTITLKPSGQYDMIQVQAALGRASEITAAVAVLAVDGPAGSTPSGADDGKMSADDALSSNPARLSCVVGIATDMLQWELSAATKIALMEPVMDKLGEHVMFPHSETNLLLLVKGMRADLCWEATQRILRAMDATANAVEVHQQMCFRYLDGRDLTGFIDGSRNFDVRLRGVVHSALIKGAVPIALPLLLQSLCDR